MYESEVKKMKKLGKKIHTVNETIESYCYLACLCTTCYCSCNPTTCGGYTSAVSSTGSSNQSSTAGSQASNGRNNTLVYA